MGDGPPIGNSGANTTSHPIELQSIVSPHDMPRGWSVRDVATAAVIYPGAPPPPMGGAHEGRRMSPGPSPVRDEWEWLGSGGTHPDTVGGGMAAITGAISVILMETQIYSIQNSQ